MPAIPKARVREHVVRSPHGSRKDPYFWLRDDSRSDSDVLAYLEAENAYHAALMQPLSSQTSTLFDEMLDRIQENDTSVPVRYRGYWYWSESRKGQQFPLYWRRAERSDSQPELLLDCNEQAKGQAFYQLGGYEVSPDNTRIAIVEDYVGRHQYRLRVKDLTTGTFLSDEIENVETSIAWTDDSASVLYIEKDAVTLLGLRVRQHVLGSSPASDPLIYEEHDESFYVSVCRSKSEQYLLISSESTVSSEWHYARASDRELKFQCFLPRERDHEYDIEHWRDAFMVRTNADAPNFKIMRAPLAPQRDMQEWREVVPHDARVFIHEFELFDTFLALSERADALRRIRVRHFDGREHLIAAADPAYTADLATNPDLDTEVLRYYYTSLTTPATVYEYNVNTREQRVLKREPVLGDFDATRYGSELLWATARDGERIPVSLVYRTDRARLGSSPLYLYGYGAYGVTIDPMFSSTRLSLLDRGFVFAIAHVRGGQELGREWYDAGRLLNKKNSFHDFIDVTRFLVAKKYAAYGQVIAAGGSAGGLLVAGVINMAPADYCAAVAHVPFVDPVTTMLDESIPLTTLEYDEWGNPNELQYYEYMLDYSPYDNVRRQAYPALLVTSGLWDSQVQYFEPAKWVAKLRAMNTGQQPILLRTEMQAGHGGKSGRYHRLHEIAEEYAFVIAAAEGRLPTIETQNEEFEPVQSLAD